MRRVDVRGRTGRALDEALAPVVEHLEADRIIAMPTATVYGLGSVVTASATERLAGLKGRDPERPFLLLIPDDDPLEGVVWTPAARALADAFWPGPLTLIVRGWGDDLPAGVRGPGGGVAVRRSPHPVVRALLARLGRPLTSTSANAPGGPPARDAGECVAVWQALGRERGEGVVIDAGRLPPSPPSTIIDCLDPVPVVHREGALPLDRLRSVLSGFLLNPDPS